jgi:HAE1 family hydrophobic/amphiphilic exporter-1
MGSRSFIFFILASALCVGTAAAQTEPPSPVQSPTPFVADPKGVLPENLLGVPPIAPSYNSNDRSLPDLARVGVDAASQRPMSLAETIALALENNRDIEVTRKTNAMAEFDLKAARGYYEPRFSGQAYYDRSTVPNVSIFSTNQTTTQGTILGNAGLTGYVPRFGTVLTGSFNNQRATTDNPISLLSPQFNSSLGFSFTQPLFRGRSIDQPRRQIEIAKRNIDITDTQFKQRSIESVAAVEKAYWDLTYALRNLQVQRDGVKDAKAQLEHNRRLVDEGQLAPIDIVASETQVANYEQAVYDALNTVNISENLLKTLISPNRNAPLWNEAIVPVDSVEVAVPTTTLDDAMNLALNNRAEMEINKFQKDINAVDQRFYKNQSKPQIDLIGSYNSAGIGGSQNPNFRSPFDAPCEDGPAGDACRIAQQQRQAQLATLFQSIGSSGTAYSDIFANRYPTYRLGLQFNLPLFGDRTSRANLGKARVEGEKLDVQRELLEQTIQAEVRNAIQSVRTNEARLRTASLARENTLKQYESEQRKLDNGQSDIYRVLERQTALTAARSNELRARTDLNKAIAELQRATGNTLTANNVTPVLKK